MVEGQWVDLDGYARELSVTVVPDANEPLMTRLLHFDPDSGGSCLLVAFPTGWERGSGAYSCFEHAVILDGSIELDGDLWEAGTSFVVPADAQRRRTFAPSGAMAVAWFSATPRWNGGGAIDGPASSAEWSGDLTDANAASDEVDALGRRWRHIEAGSVSDSSFLRYSWVH